MFFWLGIICGSLVGVLVLGLVGLFLFAQARYRRTPQKRWRDQVLRLLRTVEQRIEVEKAEIQRHGIADEAGDAQVREESFQGFLETIPVTELEAYPGIGPSTTAKLRRAGYVTLADLHGEPLPDVGLGQKRSADVQEAVRRLVEESRRRFDAGDCKEARNLPAILEMEQAARTEVGARASARLLALIGVSQRLEPLLELADQMDFASFLRHQDGQPTMPPVPREPLPDVEQAIRTADAAVQRLWAGRQQMPAGLSLATAIAAVATPWLSSVESDTAPRERPEVASSSAQRTTDLFAQALEAEAAPDGPERDMAAPEDSPVARLRLIVEFAFAAARVDGRPNHKERTVIDKHLRRRCGPNRELLQQAREFCTHFERAPIDLDNCLRQITNIFPIEERRGLLELARKITAASGTRNPASEGFLDRVARKLGLAVAPQPAVLPFPAPPPQAAPPPPPAPRPAPAPPPPDHRAALEIDPAVPLSADLVRRQWNLLSERYAPEKFTAAGPEFVALAQSKRAAALAAATALLAGLGESLEPPAPAEPPELRHNPDLDAMFE